MNKISLHSDNITVGLRYLTQATRTAIALTFLISDRFAVGSSLRSDAVIC
ncbi:hypothetical protein [Nostoc sp. ChiQUE01b]|nr:hypothetical protein [Nostoc sp. ChiQUE01b]MDZ8263656.1 hypothetical protein [Nostoc sp. ChiQUE01b]